MCVCDIQMSRNRPNSMMVVLVVMVFSLVAISFSCSVTALYSMQANLGIQQFSFTFMVSKQTKMVEMMYS